MLIQHNFLSSMKYLFLISGLFLGLNSIAELPKDKYALCECKEGDKKCGFYPTTILFDEFQGYDSLNERNYTYHIKTNYFFKKNLTPFVYEAKASANSDANKIRWKTYIYKSEKRDEWSDISFDVNYKLNRKNGILSSEILARTNPITLERETYNFEMQCKIYNDLGNYKKWEKDYLKRWKKLLMKDTKDNLI